MDMRSLSAALVLVTALGAADYADSVHTWRAEREAKLKAPDGWLSVAGLTWLKPGKNAVLGGTMTLAGDRVTWTEEGREAPWKSIKPDSDEFVVVKGAKLFIIHRGERYGVRVKDNNSVYRTSFTKLEWFPVDPSWRITAKYIPYDKPQTRSFDSQTGDKQEVKIPGVVEFSREGKTFRLAPVLEEDELFFVFRDTTAGKSTYPAARFLYAKAPGKAGPVEIDFNKAYNPPCVFTPYATCPLPPRENRLPIPIKAGEKNYHAKWH